MAKIVDMNRFMTYMEEGKSSANVKRYENKLAIWNS